MAIYCDRIVQQTTYEKRGFKPVQLEGEDNVYLDYCSSKKFIDTTDPANSLHWKEGIAHKYEGLLLAYTKPENKPILPPAISGVSENSIWCSPIGEGNIVVLNNQTAYHALPSYNVVEVAYGKGSGDIFFDPTDTSKLNTATKASPLFRIACVTFFKKEEDTSSF
jgi:hypothetical protein